MKKMLKATILTAALSAGMTLSAMAAETPAKTWEDVKNSEDPLEIIQVVEAQNNAASSMATDYLMNMTFRLGEENLAMHTTGNIKVQDADNEAMKLFMTMDANTLGETQSITAFYSDGWYYYDMGESGKYKMEMNYADALKNAQSAAGLTQGDLSYITDASVVRNGDLTTIYFTMDGAALTDMTNQVLAATAPSGPAASKPTSGTITAGSGSMVSSTGGPGGQSSMDITTCKGEYTLDANGNIIQMRMLMDTDMSSEGTSMGFEMFMEMNIKSLGDSVTVSIPSTEGYPTMEEYLAQLLADAA